MAKMIVRTLKFPRVQSNALVGAAVWAVLICCIWLATFAHLMRQYAGSGESRSAVVNKVLHLMGQE